MNISPHLDGKTLFHMRLTNYPGKRPQTVCVRSISRKCRDLDALGSKEVMVVMKVGIVVTVAVVVSECECE